MQRFKAYIIAFIICLLLTSSLKSQNTYKICAIRVEFHTDDNPLTTGDGRFVFDTTDVTPFTIDPPPHNRSYFLDQINAVANYYHVASKKQINIEGQVFPLSQNASYELPHEMGFYNPNTTDEENNYQLSQLFIDAVKQADKDADIIFSDFDLVTVFHAGVGNDINLGFDETPQDIPSLYLSPDFLKKSLGDTFGGIVVDGGNTIIDQGIMLPETESQAGFELALTGIFAANIGSFLGLYDLFSPSSKMPGIGRFGLMDSGLFNLFGLTPAIPSAFSRELMGWDNVHSQNTPRNGIGISRFTGEDTSHPSIIRIQANNSEYYLLEFRGDSQVNIDSLFNVLAEGRETFPTYLEVLKTYFPDRINVSDSTGVLIGVDDYDWGLPGAGLLIWHIDQDVINTRSGLNAINDDRDNRGVDLEEADGSQDIGYEYSIIEPGFNSELGTWLDFWFMDNPAPLYKNKFSRQSSPNSRNNLTYADSHIHLSEFSGNRGDVMTFNYFNQFYEQGFPVRLNSGDKSEYSDPHIAKTSFSNHAAIFTSDSSGHIFAITDSGKGLIQENQPIVANFSDNELPNLALADANDDNIYDHLIAVSNSGMINFFRIEDVNGDFLLDTVKTLNLADPVTARPVVKNPYFYIGTISGKIIRFHLSNGNIDSTFQFSGQVQSFTILSENDFEIQSVNEVKIAPTVIDLNSDGSYETVRWLSIDEIHIESISESRSILLIDPAVASPAYADLDDDGYYEIIVNSDKKIQAFNYSGSMVDNYPITPLLRAEEYLVGTPLILDIDRDSANEIIVLTSMGQLYIFNLNGNLLDGFPTSIGGNVSHTPVVGNIDNDDFIELVALNEQGNLYGWQFDITEDATVLWWSQSSFNPTNNYYITTRLEPDQSTASELMPSQTVYNYPNPNKQNFTIIRYFLREDAQVRIRIFDLAGDIVDSFNGPGLGNVHNEKRWNLDGVSSGVYLCRVEAISATDSSVKIVKIMIVN